MTDPRLFVPGAPAPPRACSICHQALTACRCGTTPAQAPPPARFVKRGGSMICTICDLDVRYCRGHVPVADDGRDAADLDRRVRECKGK